MLRDESEFLVAKLLRVANAVIAVEDRRADLLMCDAATAPADRVTTLMSRAAECRAVATAAAVMVKHMESQRTLDTPAG